MYLIWFYVSLIINWYKFYKYYIPKSLKNIMQGIRLVEFHVKHKVNIIYRVIVFFNIFSCSFLTLFTSLATFKCWHVWNEFLIYPAQNFFNRKLLENCLSINKIGSECGIIPKALLFLGGRNKPARCVPFYTVQWFKKCP